MAVLLLSHGSPLQIFQLEFSFSSKNIINFIYYITTQDSLKALKDKQQRTVYRLTLVKGWNTEDIDAYFNLFKVGKPDFIEIKGVTYCGS